jgi:Zn-dependent protease
VSNKVFSLPDLHQLLLSIPAFIVGLTFHEYAHGLAAYKLGDKTAYHQGRLTLNPLPHLDPVGLLMLIFFRFGWAKPVPVNPYNFQGDIKRGMMLVALAGPVTNFLLALISALLLGLGMAKLSLERDIILGMLQNMLIINLFLGVFNLLPVPPLDGSKILAGILPGRQEWLYQLEQYGMIILLLLLFTGIISKVLGFFIYPALRFLEQLANYVYVISL